MEQAKVMFDRLDSHITAWMARYGLTILRVSVGIVFLWFGFIKFFPGLSPAQDLATRTIEILSLGLLPAKTALFILAAWETIIGVGLLFEAGVYWMRMVSDQRVDGRPINDLSKPKKWRSFDPNLSDWLI